MNKKVYSFPLITKELVEAIESCPHPIDREGFHYPGAILPQLTADDLTPIDVFRFELARIWLRNFGPQPYSQLPPLIVQPNGFTI